MGGANIEHGKPFANLTPDAVLDSVDSLGFQTDGRLLALNSFENRVYRVDVEPPCELSIEHSVGSHKNANIAQSTAVSARSSQSRIVAKFYRANRWTDDQILEEHAFVQSLADNEIPAVPALIIGGQTLHTRGDIRLSVFACRGGRAPDLENEETLLWLGRFIGRIHSVGARQVFAHRPRHDVSHIAREPRDWLLQSDMIAPELLPAWSAIAEAALEQISAQFKRYPFDSIRLHGDCHAGNVLWTPDGPHFVDFDDARQGPAVQDLWMLLAVEPGIRSQQLAALLKGYRQFWAFDEQQLHLIEALRAMRLLYYSAWIARRWQDPAFVAAFPWFGSTRYWQDRILELREQVAIMQEQG